MTCGSGLIVVTTRIRFFFAYAFPACCAKMNYRDNYMSIACDYWELCEVTSASYPA